MAINQSLQNRIVGHKDVPLDQILYNPDNWRIHPKEQSEALDGVLSEVGWVQDVIINRTTGHLIDGHLRCQIAEQRGEETVPAVIVELTPEEEKLVLATLDPIAGLAEADSEKLGELLKSVQTDNENIKNLIEDIADKEGVSILDEPPPDPGPRIDEAEELREKWGVKEGQLWELGNHRLICGDCTREDVADKLIGDDIAKTIFTSPPYNTGGGAFKYYSDNMSSDEFIEFNLVTVRNWAKYLDGYLFWDINYSKNSRWEFIEILYRIIKESGLRFLELIIWDKGPEPRPILFGGMLARQYEDVLLMANEETIIRELEYIALLGTEKRAYFNKRTLRGVSNYWKIDPHGVENIQKESIQACFPLELPERGIKLTTLKDDIVVDPFVGSGTTLIACERLGRRCRAVDISPEYCAVTIQRWTDMTGREPKLISN